MFQRANGSPPTRHHASWWRPLWCTVTLWLLAVWQTKFGTVTAASSSTTTSQSPAPTSSPTPPLSSLPDILIVASVDGSLVGLSKETGEILWRQPGRTSTTSTTSTNSPKAVSEAPPLLTAPLVHTSTTLDQHTSSSTDAWRTTAVPSLDGSVVMLTDRRDQVSLTTTLETLVARTPFVDTRGRVYVSTQTSTTFGLDGTTGQVIQQMPTATLQGHDPSHHPHKDNLVWLGRVDRTVTIHEPRSGAVDVTVGAAQLLSLTDMVPEGPFVAASSTSSGSLLTTPSGYIAWRDADDDGVNGIRWTASLSTPAAYVVHAQSGHRVPVDLVPDATDGQLSQTDPEYLAQEMWRHYEQQQSVGSLDNVVEEPTLVTALPNGQLYALPLPTYASVTRGTTKPTPSLPGAAAATAEKIGVTASGATSPTTTLSHSTYQHVTGDSKKATGKPLLVKRPCQPGAAHFPGCLVTTGHNKHESLDAFAAGPSLAATHHSYHNTADIHNGHDQAAVIPFLPRDENKEAYGGHGAPHHYVWIDEEERSRRRFQRNLRVMGSWFFPVIALIFVLSFEMGRRKRQREKDELDVLQASDLAGTGSVTSVMPPQSGVIQVFDDVILGYGGHGTVVFKGLLEGRQVAVKRMLKAYHGSADREISLLIESDGHPNVVRYFLKEVRGDFVYLALELCDLSLHELIGQIRNLQESAAEDKDSILSCVPQATKGILLQIAQGVKHLHGLRIVHRDLKPANILIADSRKSKKTQNDSVCEIFVHGHYVAKISDMGLGKQIAGQSSFGGSMLGDASLRGQSNGGQSSIGGSGPGSVGWQAPEVMALRLPTDASTRSEDSGQINDSLPDGSSLDLAAHARTSRSVDIFSLGCIFYAALIPGSHPFGSFYEREVNIMHNRPNMEVLKKQSPDAYDLVSSMVQRNPSDRPTAKQVCEHPYFWPAERRLAFLCDVSDRIESEGTATADGSLSQTFVAKLLAIERRASDVVGTAWDITLDDSLVSNVQRFRTYDPSSVRDLLRLIRNKHHHYDELPETLKAKMGSNTSGLLRYFESLFPKLLIHCYNAVRTILPDDDSLLQKYSIIPISHKTGDKVSDSWTPTIPEIPSAPVTDAPESEALECPEQLEEAESDNIDAEQNSIEDATAAEIRDESKVEAVSVEDASHLPIERVDKSTLRSKEEDSPVKDREIMDSPSRMTIAHGSTHDEIIVWECSSAAKTFKNRGWSRSDEEWIRRTDAALIKPNSNLVRCAEDPKFRTRLCNHWDVSLGTFCPMRKKNKCVFAHGPVELRVKEGKRNRWGKLVDKNGDNKNPKHSGGEDTYGAARSIETERRQEGKWNVNGASKGRKGPPKKKPT